MNKYILFLTCLFPAISFGQIEKLERLNSEADVKKLQTENPNLSVNIISVTSYSPKIPLNEKILSHKKGDMFSYGNYYYKVLEETFVDSFRCRYIFLDGYKLNKSQIDSIRSAILSKFKQGVSFTKLFETYNMDGSPNKGDLNWFAEGAMVKDFENAVKNHIKNEIFIVDVPSEKWYYVVLKTHDTKTFKKSKLARLKSSG